MTDISKYGAIEIGGTTIKLPLHYIRIATELIKEGWKFDIVEDFNEVEPTLELKTYDPDGHLRFSDNMKAPTALFVMFQKHLDKLDSSCFGKRDYGTREDHPALKEGKKEIE